MLKKIKLQYVLVALVVIWYFFLRKNTCTAVKGSAGGGLDSPIKNLNVGDSSTSTGGIYTNPNTEVAAGGGLPAVFPATTNLGLGSGGMVVSDPNENVNVGPMVYMDGDNKGIVGVVNSANDSTNASVNTNTSLPYINPNS